MNDKQYNDKMNMLWGMAEVFHQMDTQTFDGQGKRVEVLKDIEDVESYMIGAAHAVELGNMNAIAALHYAGYRKCQQLRTPEDGFIDKIEKFWPKEWQEERDNRRESIREERKAEGLPEL